MNKLPPKPEGSNWTDHQWEAINRGEENILVAAGAGSGKTRVLVERIIKRLLDEQNPVELDRLLVVTFTNAAAAEMRNRIGRALEEAMARKPRDRRLRRQMLLLNRAPISTMHSFCREVLRQYHYLRDLDPSCRILDETEGDLLRQDLVEEVLEEYHQREHQEDAPFYRLLETFSADRGDERVQRLVHHLYTFSRSHPWPRTWLGEKAAAFCLPRGGLAASPWLREIVSHCLLELRGYRDDLERACRLAHSPGGPLPYVENLEAEISMIHRAVEAAQDSWEALAAILEDAGFTSLKPCRGDQYNPSLAAMARELRDRAKKGVKALQEDIFSRSLEDYEAEIRHMGTIIQVLVELVDAFDLKYREAKKERNVVDFADLEHHALAILAADGSGPGRLVPSEAARHYRERFKEVLVDEYQDTNEVQEAILQLLSRPPEEGGNLFMVGDVKQSIYRFRLAEPGLFLQKYREYRERKDPGLCIDLSKNFRSRQEILNAVNYVFSQIMDRSVGEIDYVKEASLVYGARYPVSSLQGVGEGGASFSGPGHPVEVLLISRGGEGEGPGEGESSAGTAGELDRAALEGRLMAAKIRELMQAADGRPPEEIFDKGLQKWRPLAYRDIVILLRSTENWAPSILEELQRAGIPAHAVLGSGYFEAVEVEVMLSLLKIIDNPYQDIPLAAVLRSPMVGLTGEELALVRTAAPREPFYEALKTFCLSPGDTFREASGTREKAGIFLGRLEEWQRLSREGALAELIWQIYGETGYYDLVGGMAAGGQRQANLRALYDRARQYENTSFRGLLRFLRFVEKLRERGGDLGPARALGEQEDLVRILTIHKSKGLEFPVVFLAGLGKEFNLQDLRRDFLLHRDMGFGPRFLDREHMVSYPTLPYTAVQKRLKLELLAEEMRIFYVAMTRAEDRLFLVAGVRDIGREISKWAMALPHDQSPKLPRHSRSFARSLLDWLGPALVRHPHGHSLRELAGGEPLKLLEDTHGSRWSIRIIPAAEVEGKGEKEEGYRTEEGVEELLSAVASLAPLSTGRGGDAGREVGRRLGWRYPHRSSTLHLAKMSVSELKRRQDPGEDGDFLTGEVKGRLMASPRFRKGESLTAVERGTAYHAVMQHLNLEGPLDGEHIQSQIEEMVASGKISPGEGKAVKPGDLAGFFSLDVGKRLLCSGDVRRELAFSLSLPAPEVYEDWEGPGGGEKVLLQGVIDCLFREEGGFVLLDYKTDGTAGVNREELKGRYRKQLELYRRAVESIWQERVTKTYLYFFDGGFLIPL